MSQHLSSIIIRDLEADCSSHHEALNIYASHLISTLLECGLQSIPCNTIDPLPANIFVGWKDHVDKLKGETNFWHRVWVESGCTSSGVLFQIKRLICYLTFEA